MTTTYTTTTTTTTRSTLMPSDWTISEILSKMKRHETYSTAGFYRIGHDSKFYKIAQTCDLILTANKNDALPVKFNFAAGTGQDLQNN